MDALYDVETGRVVQLVEEQGDFETALKRIAELEAALTWYGEQARLCRLIHAEGDAGRHALADDGGKRAREALER